MNLPLHDNKFIFLLTSVGAVVGLEILSILGHRIPMPYAPLIFAAFIVGIGYRVILSGAQALFKLNFSSINLLMLIAVMGALYLKEYPESAVVIVLFVLGERLEKIGIDQSRSAIESLISKSPKTAVLSESGACVEIDTISVGSVIRIKPGDLIPLDGKIISGDTTVDESAITGEFVPKDKSVGELLFAGTLNKNGFIQLETTTLSSETTFSKVIQFTLKANEQKAETQKFIQKFSRYYTPSILALSTLLFAISVVVLHLDFNHSLQQAITLLVIACPCALVISTPVAIYAAIGNASVKGALVKGGKYIEALANIKAIAFDKTRTLTFGKPIVSDVIPLNGTRREELLGCAAGLGILSEHPLAQAIAEMSKKEGFEPHDVGDFKNVPGKGVTGACLVCEGETIYIGKLDFIKEHQSISLEAEKFVDQLASEGKTSVVISFGNGAAGIIGLMDEIKPYTRDVIDAVKNLGIEAIMLTGDSPKVAKNVAIQLGITTVFADLLPEEKLTKIQELLSKYNAVAMVGDGINDAPALAQSSVGIAMGAAGSDAAIEAANIALMNDKLSTIPFLIRLSRATLRQIKINTISAIVIKLLFIGLAIGGYSNLVLAISADVGVTVGVILLSLRLMTFE